MARVIRRSQQWLGAFVFGALAVACGDDAAAEEIPSESCEQISERLGKRHYDLASYDGGVEGLCPVEDAFICGLDAGAAITAACAPGGGCCAFTSTEVPWRCGWEGCDESSDECVSDDELCAGICVSDSECQPTEACTHRIGNLMFCAPKASASGPPKECRRQCEQDCEEIAIEDFPTFDVTRAEWSKECENLYFAVAGECADGAPVLQKGTGFTSELRFYDADKNFLGLETGSDVIDRVCRGRTYWPEVIPCEAPRVTDVLCGSWKIGDAIDRADWDR